jgi:hypothetical protein
MLVWVVSKRPNWATIFIFDLMRKAYWVNGEVSPPRSSSNAMMRSAPAFTGIAFAGLRSKNKRLSAHLPGC